MMLPTITPVTKTERGLGVTILSEWFAPIQGLEPEGL
jgi:hypothetical protein